MLKQRDGILSYSHCKKKACNIKEATVRVRAFRNFPLNECGRFQNLLKQRIVNLRFPTTLGHIDSLESFLAFHGIQNFVEHSKDAGV